MIRLPTISELHRATACTASVVLDRQPAEETSQAALRGQRIHAWIAARLRKWPLPNIGKTQVKHIQLGKLRRYLGHGTLRCELAMAYDAGKAEIIGENVGRDYQRPSALCGSADIVVERPHAMIVDIKTGSYPVPSPVDNWQLATLAAVYTFARPCVSVTGVIATLARDGSWSFDAHKWMPHDLAAVRQRLDANRERWQTAHEQHESGWGVTASPGQHCKFCKARCEHNEKQASEAA